MNKKGQVVGQAFMFLLAVIVFSMVVLYGYRAIGSIGATREEAVLIEFKDSLGAYAKQVTLAYKDVKRVPLTVPNRFDEVCFVDVPRLEGKDPQGDNRFGDLFEKSPLIHDSIYSGVEQNVFLIPQAEIPITIDNIDIPDTPSTPGGAWFCMKNSGGLIVLRMEGLGNKVQISPWLD